MNKKCEDCIYFQEQHQYSFDVCCVLPEKVHRLKDDHICKYFKEKNDDENKQLLNE